VPKQENLDWKVWEPGSLLSKMFDYRVDDRGSILAEEKEFSSCLCVQTGSWGPPSLLRVGTGFFSPGISTAGA
jgi:hypothetical protein